MHALGVVHRDVKLENCFLDEAGGVYLGGGLEVNPEACMLPCCGCVAGVLRV